MKHHSLLTALIALAGLPAVFAQSPPALTYIPGSSVKLYQVNGDCDWAAWDATITSKTPTCIPTVSQTATKADVLGDDVPVAFENNGEMIGAAGGNPVATASGEDRRDHRERTVRRTGCARRVSVQCSGTVLDRGGRSAHHRYVQWHVHTVWYSHYHSELTTLSHPSVFPLYLFP